MLDFTNTAMVYLMTIALVCGISGAIAASFIKTTYLRNQRSNFKGGGKRRRAAAAGVLCASLLLPLLFVPNAQIVRADSSLGNVAANIGPIAVAVNPVTNKIYVANYNSANVTVIDGTNNSTATVAAGSNTGAVAVNPVTNKIYVTNRTSANVTVIDGTNNSTNTVAAGTSPGDVAVNPATNKIYVANQSSNNVTVIDGTNNSTNTVATGSGPIAVAVNLITNKIYVANQGNVNVTVITPATTAAIPLNTAITPAANNTTNPTPTFSLTATSTYAPNAPPPQNIYFQIDTINGAFTKAVEQSRTATTLTANASPTPLQPGLHIIYFFATDGSDATSINPNRPQKESFGKDGFDSFAPESSPIIGGINAYLFLVAPAAATAATVSVSGRVMTSDGRGIRNVVIRLTDSQGNLRTAISNSFGYYRFNDVEAGATYILTATGKRFSFSQPSQVLNVNDETDEVNFIANPIKRFGM